MPLSFLISEEDSAHFDQNELSAIAEVYADYLKPVSVEVELSLADEEEMRAINKETRSIDEPTDVLSFPVFSNKEELLEQDPSIPALMGSIVICPAKAGKYGETLTQLVHHGLLHICGYDHETDLAEWKAEEHTLLSSLAGRGLEVPGIPF